MSNLNYIDYSIIAVIGISTLVAYFRGLITEVMSLLVWIVAFWGAIMFYEDVAKILPNILGNASAAIGNNLQSFADPTGESMILTALSFITTFLGILFVAGLANLLITLLIRRLKIGWVDRFLGMFFGFARGVLAILIAGTFVVNSDISELDAWKNAKLSPTVTNSVAAFSVFIPEDFLKQINTKNLVERMKAVSELENIKAAPQKSTKPAYDTDKVAPTDHSDASEEVKEIEFIEHTN